MPPNNFTLNNRVWYTPGARDTVLNNTGPDPIEEARRAQQREELRRAYDYLRQQQQADLRLNTEWLRNVVEPRTRITPLEAPQTVESTETEMPEKNINRFMIGCDPEFVVYEPGTKKIVLANRYLNANGEAGYDHGGHVIELRPKPSVSAYTLVRRLQKILNTNPGLVKLHDKHWKAGAFAHIDVPDPYGDVIQRREMTLGGHVHIDKPHPEDSGLYAEYELMVKACDRVTKYLEDLDILPRAESYKRREVGKANEYGAFGCVRKSGSHVEYRTPCSWLHHPKAAFITMSAIKLAAQSPQIALDTLKYRDISYPNLRALFELYKTKDGNAGRAMEKLFEGKTIKDLQADPDADFKKVWKGDLEF